MKTLIKYGLTLLAFIGLISFIPSFKPSEVIQEFDFGTSKTGSEWRVMNDGVMGGLSSGKSSLTDNSLKLIGQISLANNGGFSSVRSPWGNTDISEYTDVVIRYRSKGQVVAFCLETNRQWWNPYYLIDLEATDWEWKTASFKLTAANEIAIVRPSGNQLTQEQLKAILRFGFMTHEKKESAFEFEVDYVKFE